MDGSSGIAEASETGDHTSVKEQVDYVKAQGRAEDLKAYHDRAWPDPRHRLDWSNRIG
jgi:hypothetical protein